MYYTEERHINLAASNRHEYSQYGRSKLKVGKADATDKMADGKIKRVHTSERKAPKTHPDAKATVIEDLGKTTTGEAKKAEAAKVREYREQGHKLPLNKEKDKNYHPTPPKK